MMKYKPVFITIAIAALITVYFCWPESYKSCLEKAAKSANGSGYIYKSLSDLCANDGKEKTKIDKFLDEK